MMLHYDASRTPCTYAYFDSYGAWILQYLRVYIVYRELQRVFCFGDLPICHVLSVYDTEPFILRHQYDVISHIPLFVLIVLDTNGTQASAVGKENIIIQHAYTTNAIYDAISSQTVYLAYPSSHFIC